METFQNREEVIVPCNCSGDIKYVCKLCLNTSMNLCKSDQKYTHCPTCKGKFKREIPDISGEINAKTRNFALITASIITLLLGVILYLSQYKNIFFIFLLFVYFITSLYFIMSFGPDVWFGRALVFLFIITLNLPFKFAYGLFSLWLLTLYGLFSYELLKTGWDYLYTYESNRMIKDLKCQMFDLDLKRYVNGII